MAKKKQTDVKIKIAIISGIFLVMAYGISAYVGSPIMDTQWKERAIANVSFGDNDEFPKSILQQKEGEFFIDIVLENRGTNNAKTILVADGHGAKVRLGKTSEWSYLNIVFFTIKPDLNKKTYPLYVMPENNTTSFMVELSLQEHDQPTPFQELILYSPTILTFEKENEQFVLVGQR